MSHQQLAGSHGVGSPEDEQLHDVDVSAHGDATEEHDQIVLTQSTAASAPSSTGFERDRPTSPPSSAGEPGDESHLNTPHAATFTPPHYTSPALTSDSGGWSHLAGSRLSAATTLTAPDLGSIDTSTAVGSEHRDSKERTPGWQSFSRGFKPSLREAANDSPISPLTVRDLYLQDLTSQGSDATDSASQSSIGHATLSNEYSEPDVYEGISLQKQPFRRPRSHRSSGASSATARRAPGLLTLLPRHRRDAAFRIFADPLAPPSADLDLGLPSIRHIIDSDDGIGGETPEQPTVFKENALVNHLESLQREAADCWERAQGASEQDRETIVNDIVTRLWQTSVNYLADLLRSNKMIRRLATAHRVSLGEVDKLRQYSQDTEERSEQREYSLSLDLEGLKEENKRLHRQLALRDLSIAKSVSAEDESLRMAYWIQNQPFVPNSSFQVSKNVQPPETLEVEGKPDMGVGETPKQPLKQWSDLMPPLKEEPWKDVKRRDSGGPNHEDVVELLQKIQQLRDDIEHEKFLREATQEAAVQLEKELDLAHGFTEDDEPSKLDDVESNATKRIAEIAGARAALRTSQKNYEKEQTECAFLQKTCDELEERIAEKDHKILMLERDLKEVQNDLFQERGELMDAMLRIEDMEAQLVDYEKQVRSTTAEISGLEYQVDVLVPDLNAAQAGLEDLRRKNAALEEKNYDLLTDNVYKIQCAEHEETLRKLKEAELEETKDELAKARAAYDDSRTELEDYILYLEDVILEHKTEQDELRNEIEKHRTTIGELEVTISSREIDIQGQRNTIQTLRESNKSVMEDAQRLARNLKSLRGEARQRRFEELRRRCRRHNEQRAAWRHELRDTAGKRSRAEQRYRQEHRALMKARRELEKMRQQRHLDAERERQHLEQISFLERECDKGRLALQDAQLLLASTKQIEKTHDREIDDTEGILGAPGQDVQKDGETKPVLDFSHTALPQPPVSQERIVTRTVEHHHSEACFCSLVEYWFPGALESVLPRRWDTDDSRFGSGRVHGHDGSLRVGGTPEDQDVPNDEDFQEDTPGAELEETLSASDGALQQDLSDDLMSETEQESTSQAQQEQETRQGESQHREAQPPKPAPRPRGTARRVTFVDEDDPVASLLDLIDSSVRIPPIEPEDEVADDVAFYASRTRHYHHGHTTTDGPFEGPVHFLCQLLTALAWLAMLVLSQPGNVLSTIAILAGHFILPLRFILCCVLYYIRLPFYHGRRLVRRMFRYPPPERNLRKPAWPVLGRPSAAGIVSTVIALMVVFLVVALGALGYEREIWVRASRWTDAYLRDIVYRKPYPWWSPLEVDFRLVAWQRIRWKVNALAFGGRYFRSW